MVGYPAAVSVPLAFVTMVAGQPADAGVRSPPTSARIFARMHAPERLGMGIDRVRRAERLTTARPLVAPGSTAHRTAAAFTV